MELLIILFVIISLISNANKKKKEAAEKARRQVMAESGGHFPDAAPAAPQGRRRARPDARFPDFEPLEGEQTRMEDPRFPPYVPGEGQASPFYETPESEAARQAEAARARREAEEQIRKERTARASQKQPIVPRTNDHAKNRKLQSTQGRRHVLEASGVSGHAHTESSMTGFEHCPPVPTAATAKPHAPSRGDMGVNAGSIPLRFDGSSVTAGILYGEILGKPKALRR